MVPPDGESGNVIQNDFILEVLGEGVAAGPAGHAHYLGQHHLRELVYRAGPR